MNKKLILLACFWLFGAGFAHAQLKKIHSDPLIWTDLQADYFLPDQSYFFFRNQWRHNTNNDFAGLKESGPLHQFYEMYALVGYDHRFTERWSARVFARYTFRPVNNNVFFQGALRHTGHIGSVDFIKQLAFDYIKPQLEDSRGRIRPFAALEKNFRFGNHTMRPQLSYELFFNNDFKDEQSGGLTRTVDRTRLRVAASYKATPYLWITPYFMKQTDYFNVLSTFTELKDANNNPVLDDDGNPVLVENKGGKRNRIDPVFGLDLRFIIHAGRQTDSTLPRLVR
ncbi:MAG TPA: hypothetical protein VK927_04980 [Adhaeribacter sp.]|nr:hypothetical protein [Adhaeribacter sp.]